MRTASSIALTCIWILSLAAVGSGPEAPPWRTDPPIVTAKKELNKTPSSWKAGVAKANITPKEPMWLAGYGGRDHPAEGKLHDLWIKAMALQDARGRRIVLVTSDLCGIPKW